MKQAIGDKRTMLGRNNWKRVYESGNDSGIRKKPYYSNIYNPFREIFNNGSGGK